MTVDELLAVCTKLTKEGKGNCPVVWQSLAHVWPVEELRETKTTRSDKAFLVNP